MNSISRLVSLVFVSILGLVSCTATKDAEGGGGGETRAGVSAKTQDSWAIPEPVLEGAGGGSGRPIRHASVEAVPADSVIVFPDTAKKGDAAFAEVTFDTITTCETSLGPLKAESKLIGTRKIPLRSLLPPALWRRLEFNDAKNPTCTFTIKAKNKIGSSHGFTMERLEIAYLSRLENLHLQDARSGKAALSGKEASLSDNDVNSLRLPELPEAGADANFDVICDKFRNSRRAPGPHLPASLAYQLISGKVQSLTGGSESSAIDSRLTNTSQSCRIAADSIDAKTGLRQVWVSPKFRVQFPLPSPQVNASLGIEIVGDYGARAAPLNGKTWFQIQLRNHHGHAMAFRFPAVRSMAFFLQPIGYRKATSTTVHGTAFENVLNLSVSTGNRVWNHGPDLVIELTPGAAVTIEGKIQTPVTCFGNPRVPGEPGWYDYIQMSHFGFAYRFGAPLYLKQYTSWNSAEPRLESETVDVSPVHFATDSHGSLLSGWAPFPDYKTVDVSMKRPPLIVPNTDPIGTGCHIYNPGGPYF